MLASAYTLQKNEHIRIDIFYGSRSHRTQDWIDLFGHVFFLLPFCLLMLWLLVPYVTLSFRSGEMSTNAGGLIIWPAKALLLAGFVLLTAQAMSEIIKRIAIMRGMIEDPVRLQGRRTRSTRQTSMPRTSSMVELIAQNMAPIMFASLVVFLLLGYPVAFALAANGLLFFFVGVELAPFSHHAITLSWPLLGALPERFWGIMSNETLLAIPFFTFMGLMLERSGMAEDLLETIGQLFGPVRGGLGYAVVLVGALLAATTGVVAASVISMGLISLPIMLRYGYDRRVATGIIAASGTLAQIIPPSLVLIVMADQLGRSVGDMYEGAIIPGLILTGLYLGYILLLTIFFPKAAPALPAESRSLGSGMTSLLVMIVAIVAVSYGATRYFAAQGNTDAGIWGAIVGVAFRLRRWRWSNSRFGLSVLSRLAQQVIIVLIPPLALIFLVLGTIFLGIATPTEGGAMGAVGALALALAKRRLTLDIVTQALASTTRLSAFVMFILIGARVFSLTFYGVNGHIWVEHLLSAAPGGQIGFLIVVNAARLRARLLPRFLRARLHHRAAAGAGRREARHRPDLVRRPARHQHADELHASPVRLLAVLPAFGGAAHSLCRCGHGRAARPGQDFPDLLGLRAVRLHPGHHGRPLPRIPEDGDALQGRRAGALAAADRAAATRRRGPVASRRRPAAALRPARFAPRAGLRPEPAAGHQVGVRPGPRPGRSRRKRKPRTKNRKPPVEGRSTGGFSFRQGSRRLSPSWRAFRRAAGSS